MFPPNQQATPAWLQILKAGGAGGGGMAPTPNNPWPALGKSLGAMAGAGIKAYKKAHTPDDLLSNGGAAALGGPAAGHSGQGMSDNMPGYPYAMNATGDMPDYLSGDSASAEPMAAGKVVTKPTLALIGEDQPEAVVPLDGRRDAKVRPGMARNYYGG